MAKYTKFDPIKFENDFELYNLLRDKSKDWHHKEGEELKKFLRTNRKQNIARIIVLPKLNEIETKKFQKDWKN